MSSSFNPTKEQFISASASEGEPLGNKEVIQLLYDLFSAGQYHRLEELFHTDAVWVQMDGFPGGGTYRGTVAIRQGVFGGLKKDWLTWEARVQAMMEAEDSVFVIGSYQGTHRITEKSFSADFIHHYQLCRGRISAFKQYTDTARIVAATLA